MKKIVIYGAGGFAKEIIWLIEEINSISKEWELLGIIDDNLDNFGREINNYKVLGGKDCLTTLSNDIFVIIALGDGNIRKKIYEEFPNKKYATLVHPSVKMSSTNKIGKGSIICAGCNLTVNITIGEHSNINLDCTVAHDCKIGDFVSVFPQVAISGSVKIGSNTTVGTGSVIVQKLIVGENVTIASMSNVTKNISDNSIALGNPIKIIKK
ncbi:acetyltransferase [Fusobacterium hwasookii]|uniref:acetyltransferase n=1 Tax=Fusobacterium hwasookii TaxID=1583098 RepID=UPI0016231EB5|nr:acetyltransferase [Fusobacterium hwasookii]QNE66150.1 acetyltransferase [Fusobacterium hwasookii]